MLCMIKFRRDMGLSQSHVHTGNCSVTYRRVLSAPKHHKDSSHYLLYAIHDKDIYDNFYENARNKFLIAGFQGQGAAALTEMATLLSFPT